jgi:hypothetical protein
MSIVRTIEIFNKYNGKWEDIDFQHLVNGDIFRIFDGGERYINKEDGNNIWIATGNPYLNEDKIWTINTLY